MGTARPVSGLGNRISRTVVNTGFLENEQNKIENRQKNDGLFGRRSLNLTLGGISRTPSEGILFPNCGKSRFPQYYWVF